MNAEVAVAVTENKGSENPSKSMLINGDNLKRVSVLLTYSPYDT